VKGNKAKKQNSKGENFPQWFVPSKGGTIYEWICAFFEQLITNRYLHYINSGLQNGSRAQLYSVPDVFEEFVHFAKHWNALTQPDKIKVIYLLFK
jgi:hypothetical protein